MSDISDGPFVLVVDDEEDIRDAIASLLEEAGYAVAQAIDGAAALEQLEAGLRPGLILLDWMMPSMDGGAFLQAIAGSAELSAIPVIVMTAASPSPETSSLPFPLLRKPFEAATLVQAVAQYCPRLWDDEAPTSEQAVLTPVASSAPVDTSKQTCVSCGRRASMRCAGCGEAFCKACLDAGPDGRCATCWRATHP